MIKIYTKDYCPYCVQAKNLFSALNISYQEIDVTNDPEALSRIVEVSHMRTVPQIFIGDTCIGGYADVAELHRQGKLISKIEEMENAQL